MPILLKNLPSYDYVLPRRKEFCKLFLKIVANEFNTLYKDYMKTTLPYTKIIRVDDAFNKAIEQLKREHFTRGISDTIRRVVLLAAKDLPKKGV
jgi:ABC-type sulfate transport system substrate-binding protein